MIPSPLSKAQLLHQLEQRITTEIKDAWLFPQRGAVSGFLGTAPIVIVGWRPAWSTFANEGANKLFYEILKDFGLENAHLTNIIKSRGHKDEPDPSNFALHEEIFIRELEILDAWHGVAPMGRSYERVAALISNLGTKPIYRLPMYASMDFGPDRIDIFRKAIKDLAAIAQRNGWIATPAIL
jgi:hypothetical protein